MAVTEAVCAALAVDGDAERLGEYLKPAEKEDVAFLDTGLGSTYSKFTVSPATN